MIEFLRDNMWDIIQSVVALITLVFSTIAYFESRKANAIAKDSNEKADDSNRIAKESNNKAHKANKIAEEANKIADKAKTISLVELAPAVICKEIKVESKSWYELRNETTFDFQGILVDGSNQYKLYEVIQLGLINKGGSIITEITIEEIILYCGDEYSVMTDEDNLSYVYLNEKQYKKYNNYFAMISDDEVMVNIFYENKDIGLVEFIDKIEYGTLKIDFEIKTINNITYKETLMLYFNVVDSKDITINKKAVSVEVVD